MRRVLFANSVTKGRSDTKTVAQSDGKPNRRTQRATQAQIHIQATAGAPVPSPSAEQAGHSGCTGKLTGPHRCYIDAGHERCNAGRSQARHRPGSSGTAWGPADSTLAWTAQLPCRESNPIVAASGMCDVTSGSRARSGTGAHQSWVGEPGWQRCRCRG